jgi:SulP family sulfate permease
MNRFRKPRLNLIKSVTLAFLVGAIEVVMGLLRLGFLVNFLSRSVTSGFISGAAVIIGFSQVKHLLGLKIPATESFSQLVTLIIRNLSQTNWLTLALGIASVGILVSFNRPLVKQLKQQGWSVREASLKENRQILPISKSAPLVVVILGTFSCLQILPCENWQEFKS